MKTIVTQKTIDKNKNNFVVAFSVTHDGKTYGDYFVVKNIKEVTTDKLKKFTKIIESL